MEFGNLSKTYFDVLGLFLLIPMRHAARTPPPPDFVACGLLRLMLFRKLQNALDSFEVSVRSHKFSEVLFQFSAGILH